MTRVYWRSLVAAAAVLLALPGAWRAASLPVDSVGTDWSRVPEYRLVPGDVLNLNFGPSPTPPSRDVIREVMVRPDGRITVYPVGDVIAAGRTPRELEGVIVDLLSVELREPRVTVEVAELGANKVHVLGQVKKPGSYDMQSFMTVTQAIAAAGGFEEDAASNSVLVFRRDGARTVQATRIRLDKSIQTDMLLADLPLSRFDIVYVPRSTIGNVRTFARLFFSPVLLTMNSALLGWELFNLDRVFVSRAVTTNE